MKKEIPVFFTADNGYAPYLAVAIHSLVKNASTDYHYKIIVLHEQISIENQNKIKSLENDRTEIMFR